MTIYKKCSSPYCKNGEPSQKISEFEKPDGAGFYNTCKTCRKLKRRGRTIGNPNLRPFTDFTNREKEWFKSLFKDGK